MILKGIAGSEGICIGKAYLYTKEEVVICRDTIDEDKIQIELKKVDDAVKKARTDLTRIRDKVTREHGEENAEIFDAHLLVLEDPELIGTAKNTIQSEKIGAAAALDKTVKQVSKMLNALDDEYLKARAVDIEDVGNRLIRYVSGTKLGDLSEIQEPSIVVAEDLTPSDTAVLDKNYVLGMVCEVGSRTSHTVILARSLDIPAIVGTTSCTKEIKDGDLLVVNGFTGEVLVNPEQEVVEKYKKEQTEYEEYKKKLKELINLPAQTPDGRTVEVSGNIGSHFDIDDVVANGGDGVGLFRTEFFYMNNDNFPTEQEQFASYKCAAEKLEGKPLIIRTMDIGGDKKLPYFKLPQEMNPFLGYRAVRICLDKKDMFKTQLRAILRASVFGNIWIMFPMISNIGEIRAAKAVVEEAKSELRAEGIKFDESTKVGIMVEIPAAAVQAHTIAKEVDFFSIGTNDLCQYTLAVDRMNEKVAHLYQPLHPAVIALIKNVIDAGRENNIMVGMCGEMASDKLAAVVLLGLGLDEFSMSASSMLKIKEIIRKIRYEDAKKIAQHTLTLATSDEVAEYIKKSYKELGVL